ncbi:Response regulator receiver domain protein [Photobacterium damselae subsp. piscicida]|uniref:Response regulator n=1 Tax=Photobacterium damsela subsp. piscicida TaxID=38294 RepID=A0A1V1VCH9_PHODP|nr:response regulator [Photobacterium damselae]MDP2531163.1 response regulator [Photobacterium damselae subsp. piscicida]MDP2556514.1 response regulator [Photobacterium damselae subsp. piscicida]QOD54642.1 response regulator [Photobacterium damselae subsp. piscicida]QOD57997.1 response regulator [Photobacterium damselae subsp. piscicida]BAX55898.1 Response regulator receiver domain protein [Photobacterium damselae subsp. piscicida]
MKNILIIENNHFQANMLKHMLERIGFELIYLSDSTQTRLSICQSQAIDIILCDIELTSIDSVVTPIDLLMVKFTFYKRSNNLIVHLFAFRKTNGFSY